MVFLFFLLSLLDLNQKKKEARFKRHKPGRRPVGKERERKRERRRPALKSWYSASKDRRRKLNTVGVSMRKHGVDGFFSAIFRSGWPGVSLEAPQNAQLNLRWR